MKGEVLNYSNVGTHGTATGADAVSGGSGELLRQLKDKRELFCGYTGVDVRVIVNPEEAMRAQSLRLGRNPIRDFVKNLLRGADIASFSGAEIGVDSGNADGEPTGPLLCLQILLTGLLSPETPWCTYGMELSVLQAVTLADDIVAGKTPYDAATAATWQVSDHGFLPSGRENLAARVYEGITKTVGDFIIDYYTVNVIDFNAVNAR